MKVTTLNLAGYKNWNDREAKIVSYLESTQSDMVFLQEVKFDTKYSPYSQSKHLNSQLPTPYPYGQSSVSRFYLSSDGSSSREGLAVLSMYPIVDSEIIVLTKQPDDKHTRIIQKVSLRIDNQIVDFTNVHFSNNQYSIEQLDETLAIIKSRGEGSVVIGDFNISDLQTISPKYSPDYVASADVTEYVSFPSEGATFDYALVPKKYQLSSVTTHEGLSDHNALTFELNMKI